MFQDHNKQDSGRCLLLPIQAPQTRSFAEAALQEPTIPIHGVYGRYAMALFQAGLKKGDLDKIDKDLEEVS